MRILIISQDFPPAAFGGMAQHAWHIADQLSRRHAVRVLIPANNRAEWGEMPFAVSPSLSMRLPSLDVLTILREARRFGPDAIHVCNAALSYTPVSRRYPTVTRVVGNDFLRPWCGYGLPLRSLLYRLPGEATRARVRVLETEIRKAKTLTRLKRVDAVVANSEWTREQLVAEGVPAGLVRTIVGGVDTAVFHPPVDKYRVRRQVGLPEDSRVLLTAANLVAKKGIDTVLRVVARLAPKWPSLRYVVVGDGPREAHLRGLAADLGVGEQVIFVGRKTQEELCRYYQAADVYAQTSRNHRLDSGYVDVETMGRTYMEAGACGVPVVAARVGGVPSVVIDGVNGLLVEHALDEGEIAAAIGRVLGDGELGRRLGGAGLKMARERFSWERVAAAFENVMVPSMGSAIRDAVNTPFGWRESAHTGTAAASGAADDGNGPCYAERSEAGDGA